MVVYIFIMYILCSADRQFCCCCCCFVLLQKLLVKVTDIFQHLCTWKLVMKFYLIISSHADGTRHYSIIKYCMIIKDYLNSVICNITRKPRPHYSLCQNLSLCVTSTQSANLHYHFSLTRSFGRQFCNFLFKQHVRSRKFGIHVNEW